MRPIFIGGCQRSGTTFLGSLFQCVEGACVTPESVFKHEIPFDNGDEGAFRSRLDSAFRFQQWGLGDVSDLPLTDERSFYTGLIERYMGGSPEYWVDHTPLNILEIDRLKSVYPDAKFIHILRDGRAVAASVIPLDWGPNTPAAAARDWLRFVGPGLAGSLFRPDTVLTVQYEELVRNPVQTMNQVFEFCDMETRVQSVEDFVFSSSFLPHYDQTGQQRNVGQLPNPSSIDRWKKHLSPEDIALFEYVAGATLGAIGYPLEGRAGKPSEFSQLFSEFKNITKRVFNIRKYHKVRGLRYGRII